MDCECNIAKSEFVSNIACTSTGHLVEEHELLDVCKGALPIKVNGVCSEEKLRALLGDGEYLWTQFFLPEVLCIPQQKPDIEQLLSVTSRAEIISQRVIRTPVSAAPNQEGTNLTGRKLVIEGILKQKGVPR